MNSTPPSLIDRIHQVDWTQFETAYGNAGIVADQLIALVGKDKEKALDTSHDLWCGLCHQHAYVSSAALPSYPFLKEVLQEVDEELATEILDILLGFAVCTRPDWPSDTSTEGDWRSTLRTAMLNDFSMFKRLTQDKNEYIKDFAEGICEHLELMEIVEYSDGYDGYDGYVSNWSYVDANLFDKIKNVLARVLVFIGIR